MSGEGPGETAYLPGKGVGGTRAYLPRSGFAQHVKMGTHTRSVHGMHTDTHTQASPPRATWLPSHLNPPPTKPRLPPTLYVQSCENSTTLKVNKAHLLKIAPVSMVTPATQNLFINGDKRTVTSTLFERKELVLRGRFDRPAAHRALSICPSTPGGGGPSVCPPQFHRSADSSADSSVALD